MTVIHKQDFAEWVSAKAGRYIYACWDTDTAAITAAPGTTFGEYVTTAQLGSVSMFYNTAALAALALGIAASINFSQTNGRITFSFKRSTGMSATVSSATAATNLLANGYNFYGSYATANDSFVWLYNGSVSGSYKWLDTQINAIWLTNQIQLAEMSLMQSAGSIPYNSQGYNLIKAAAQDPINSAVNFGAIRGGVNLSAAQIAQVNAAAGVQIDVTLATRGWYLQVLPASAQVRALRQSPPCSLWYMDGGAVHQLNIASIAIQ